MFVTNRLKLKSKDLVKIAVITRKITALKPVSSYIRDIAIILFIDVCTRCAQLVLCNDIILLLICITCAQLLQARTFSACILQRHEQSKVMFG